MRGGFSLRAQSCGRPEQRLRSHKREAAGARQDVFWGVEVTTRRVRRGVEHLGGLAGVWPGRGVAGVGSGGSDGFLRWMCEELTSLFTCSFHSERLWGCPFPFMV